MAKTISSMIKNVYKDPFRYSIASRQEYWCCWLVSHVILLTLPLALLLGLLLASVGFGSYYREVMSGILAGIGAIFLFPLMTWNNVVS